MGHRELAVGTREHSLLRGLDPEQPVAVGADAADQPPADVALGIDATRIGQDPDAGDLLLAEPLGVEQVDLAGDVLEAGIGSQRLEQLLLVDAEVLGELCRRPLRVLDL
jgi:hypothetical protein